MVKFYLIRVLNTVNFEHLIFSSGENRVYSRGTNCAGYPKIVLDVKYFFLVASGMV